MVKWIKDLETELDGAINKAKQIRSMVSASAFDQMNGDPGGNPGSTSYPSGLKAKDEVSG